MERKSKNNNKKCRSMTLRNGNTKIEVTASLITILINNN